MSFPIRSPGRWVATLAASLLVGAWSAEPGAAQQPRATLSLDEAITLALRHNPIYQARRAEEADADWAVREAYGALLPGAGVNMGLQYQAEGQPRFGAITGGDFGVQRMPPYYLSDYYVGLSYQVGPGSFFRPAQARSQRTATLAGIDAARAALVVDVTRQYLTALRARDAVELSRRELERAQEHVKLAEARVAVGAAPGLDARQAEVERGRAEVAVIQAENQARVERLRLMERLGVEVEADVELTTDFDVFDPPWALDRLVELAAAAHPQIESLRAAEQAGDAGIRVARSSYLPTIELSAGLSGFTRQAGDSESLVRQARAQAMTQIQSCELLNQISAGLSEPLPGTPADCTLLRFTEDQEAALLRQNDVFPFNFTSQPFVARLQVSLPLFQGFSRQRRIEQARLAAGDARHRRRAEELRVRTEVEAAFLSLTTARRVVTLEERNVELAADQLRLARDRYELGAGSFIELLEAETIKARADRALLDAIYGFHEGLAALEAAVGQPLRRTEAR